MPLVNSTTAHLTSSDKKKSHEAFAGAGINTPTTWSALPQKDYYPLICKPRRGSGGEGVALVYSEEEAKAHLLSQKQECIFQEYIATKRCLRVVCTNSKIICTYEKRAAANEIVASVKRGSKRISLVATSPELEEMAIEMVSAVGGGLMGVDVLQDHHGTLWALETNASFAFDPANKLINSAFVKKIEEIAYR